MNEAERQADTHNAHDCSEYPSSGLPRVIAERNANKQRSEPYDPDYYCEDQIDRIASRFFAWLKEKRTGPHEWLVAFATVVLMFVSCVQLAVSCSNSAQTDKIIAASEKSAGAANRFATAAEGIQQGVSDAAGELSTQAGIASKQWTATQQMLESQRAAITVDPLPTRFPITFFKGDMLGSFPVLLRNNGSVKAENIFVRWTPSYVPMRGAEIFTEPKKRQMEFCRLPAKHDKATAPLTIFSGGSKESDIAFGIRKPTEEEMVPRPPGSTTPTEVVLPIIVGCVDYQSGTMPEPHQTGFIFEVHRLIQEGSNPIMIRMGVDVPPDKVLIVKYAFSQEKDH